MKFQDMNDWNIACGFLMPGIRQIAKECGITHVVADIDGIIFIRSDKHERIFSEQITAFMQYNAYHQLNLVIKAMCNRLNASPENVPEVWKYLYGEVVNA